MTKSKTTKDSKFIAEEKTDAYCENDPRLRGKQEKKLEKQFYEEELFRL